MPLNIKNRNCSCFYFCILNYVQYCWEKRVLTGFTQKYSNILWLEGRQCLLINQKKQAGAATRLSLEQALRNQTKPTQQCPIVHSSTQLCSRVPNSSQQYSTICLLEGKVPLTWIGLRLG